MSEIKTPEQVLFAELVERAEERDWSRAQIARTLGISRQAVTMYCSGRSNPSERTLDGMRGIVAELEQGEGGGDLTARDAPLSPQAKLGFLERHHPDRAKSASVMIDALYEQAVKAGTRAEAKPENPAYRRFSSATVDDARVAADAAEKAIEYGRQKAKRPSRGAGAPSARKSSPSPGSGGQTNRPQQPPKEVQK